MPTVPIVPADKDHQETGNPPITPYKRQGKPAPKKDPNHSHTRPRRPGQRANAHLKTSKTLTKLRCRPHHPGHLAQAIHTLQLPETANR